MEHIDYNFLNLVWKIGAVIVGVLIAVGGFLYKDLRARISTQWKKIDKVQDKYEKQNDAINKLTTEVGIMSTRMEKIGTAIDNISVQVGKVDLLVDLVKKHN